MNIKKFQFETNKIYVENVTTKYNCISCILRYTMMVGIALGISPIKCVCPHSKKYYSVNGRLECGKSYFLGELINVDIGKNE